MALLDTDEQCGCPVENGHTYHYEGCPEQPCACEDPVEGPYRLTECNNPDCPFYWLEPR